MKMAQNVDAVRERERESYILVKRNVELVSFLTQTSNFIKNTQAKNISFINNTKKGRLYAKKSINSLSFVVLF